MSTKVPSYGAVARRLIENVEQLLAGIPSGPEFQLKLWCDWAWLEGANERLANKVAEYRIW
jgi:hypothetical protein